MLSTYAYHHSKATPLMLSICSQSYVATAMLVAAGARLELTNSHGCTAADLATLDTLHMNSCDFSDGNWSCCEDEDLSKLSVDRYASRLTFGRVRAERARDLECQREQAKVSACSQDSGNMCQGGKLKQECRSAWAQFYVRFAELLKEKGHTLWGFSVQNEPDGQTPWENCLYRLDLKLIAWDHNRDDLIYSDPEAAKYVWGMGWHWYGDPRYEWWADAAGQACFENVRKVHELRPEKHLLVTETCQECGAHLGDWSLAERYAESIIKDFNNWCEAWVDWNFLLTLEGGPNHVGNHCSAPVLADLEKDRVIFNPSYFAFGHFSRWDDVRVTRTRPRKICSKMGGASVRFNNPCAWAHGQAQMTAAHFTNMCKGATRMIHWHTQADEWGFVSKGRLMTFVASPDGLPWPSSTNVLSPRGEFTIIFASPQAAEPNGHNLDTTFAQADDDVAAQALDLSLATYEASRPAFGRAKHSIHYSNRNMTAPIVTAVLGGECDPECPPIQETVGAPAAVQSFVEQKVLLPHTEGVTLYRIKTDQFPFSRTMSQERTELAPGADSILMVVSGTVTVSLEGGILGNESHLEFAHETLEKGDVAYFPNGRAYWFREATGKHPAETINVFNVGIWKSIELRQAVSEMPRLVVMSNLHQAEYIHAGAKRVLCASNRDCLEVTAFLNPDRTLVAVVLNQTKHYRDLMGDAGDGTGNEESNADFMVHQVLRRCSTLDKAQHYINQLHQNVGKPNSSGRIFSLDEVTEAELRVLQFFEEGGGKESSSDSSSSSKPRGRGRPRKNKEELKKSKSKKDLLNFWGRTMPYGPMP
eukprot:g24399.t1